MAKKIALGGTLLSNPAPLPGDPKLEDGVVEFSGVRTTAGSARNPNIAGSAGENDAIHPLVRPDVFDTADANDGSEDGKQDSFTMPPFANGVDSRKRHSY